MPLLLNYPSIHRVDPVRPVLDIPECRGFGSVTKNCRLLERQLLSLSGHQCRPSSLSRFDGVDPLANLLTRLSSAITCISKRDVRIAAKPNVSTLGTDLGTEDPATGAGVLDLQVKAGNAADRMQAGLLQPLYLYRC